MNVYEELAVLTAMEKAVKDRIKSVRVEANASIMDAYEGMGVEKLALKVGEQKVGEFIVTFAKEGFEITDRKAFEEFALDYGMATTRKRIRPDMEQSAIRYLESSLDPEVFAETVEEKVTLDPDWEKGLTNVGGLACYMDSGLSVPGVEVKPKAVKGTMVRECKPEKVFPVVANLPGGFNGYLLGGEVS